MVEINLDSLAERIYAHWKARGDGQSPRAHLGASICGKACAREVWQNFRWVALGGHPGRIYRLFDTGKREELRLIEDLKAIGIEILGEQVTFESEFNPHLQCTVDVIARGFDEAPEKKHVVSFKTVNRFTFGTLPKKGLEQVYPHYVSQLQLEMHLSGVDRGMFIAVCKDTDEIYTERVLYSPSSAGVLIERARQMVEGPRPKRISDDPGAKECKFCSFWMVCHSGSPAERHCRTCQYAAATGYGQKRNWRCARHQRDLSVADQLKGCEDYVCRDDLQREGLESSAEGAQGVQTTGEDNRDKKPTRRKRTKDPSGESEPLGGGEEKNS